jgi:hypothetical protein
VIHSKRVRPPVEEQRRGRKKGIAIPALASFSRGEFENMHWFVVAICSNMSIYNAAFYAGWEGDVKTIVTGSIALALVVAAGGLCSAQVITHQEPMEGQLRTGVTVFVDDGTCGRGMIKLITATGGNGNERAGLPQRTRTCVPRPSNPGPIIN